MWYVYSSLPSSDASSDGSYPPSPPSSPKPPRRHPHPAYGTLPCICLDTSVASLVLNGELLTSEKYDELMCIVTKWKEPVDKDGGPMNFPPTRACILTFEWVQQNFGNFSCHPSLCRRRITSQSWGEFLLSEHLVLRLWSLWSFYH